MPTASALWAPAVRGTAAHFGVMDGVDVLFNTFAKSMAGIGAFVSGPRWLINLFRYNMRSQLYAKSLPMPMVMGALKRLDLIRKHPEYQEKLWEITRALQKGLTENGFNIGVTQSPVTPIYMKGGEQEGTNLIYDLRENYGLFCSIVVYPVIPRGEIILRVIPTAAHTMEDVEFTINTFKAVRAKFEAGEYIKADSVGRRSRFQTAIDISDRYFESGSTLRGTRFLLLCEDGYAGSAPGGRSRRCVLSIIYKLCESCACRPRHLPSRPQYGF